MAAPDAIIVGAGPNGLSAAIVLARAGCRVSVYEGQDRVGGGCSSAELTLPGFVHDVCSAVHPMAVASPFQRPVPHAGHGVARINPPPMLAQPVDDVIVRRRLSRRAGSALTLPVTEAATALRACERAQHPEVPLALPAAGGARPRTPCT